MPGRPFDRRQFLQMLASMGVAVYLPGCTGETKPDSSGKDSSAEGLDYDVIVLGGGVAGLSAAWELAQKGYSVVVLEAQQRVGGRVQSKSDGFEGGQYIEVGAARIPDVHEHTLEYVEKLGLELHEIESGDPLYYLKGNRFMHTEGMAWPLDLTEEEQAEGLGMWGSYIAGAFEDFGNPRDGTFPKADAFTTWDPVPYTDFVRARGASEDWILLYTADNGSEISKIGTLAWMAAEVADQNWDKTYKVKGGNDQIPKGIAAELGDAVWLGSVVKKIATADDRVTITVEVAGVSQELTASRCICALPFTILRDIEITPALAEDKTRCINELFMMGSSRGFFQTKTRFWKDEGIGGLKIAKTDTAAERLWDLSIGQDGENGMFMVYTQHENAIALAAVPEGDRQEHLLGLVEDFFPQIRDELVHFDQKIWADDPYVKGAWADILPDQGWMFTVVGRAEGRIHFCGEHTSIWAGWMQGAIESAKRAVAEVVAAG